MERFIREIRRGTKVRDHNWTYAVLKSPDKMGLR
jgi:hypothetical protein